MTSVIANPRIGPVPNWNRNAAAMSDAMCVSSSVRKTRANPALMAARTPRCAASSSLMRSKISTFESTPMPIVRTNPAMPGQRHRRAEVRHQAEQDDEVEDQRDDRVDARQLVVDEHEDDDQHEADDRGEHARSDRVGAERRADRRAPRGRSGSRAARRSAASSDRSCDFLRREAAADAAFVADAAVDARRRHDAVVEHDGQGAADVLAGDLAELARAFVRQREADGRPVVLVDRRLRAAQILPVTAATLRTR